MAVGIQDSRERTSAVSQRAVQITAEVTPGEGLNGDLFDGVSIALDSLGDL
jgi:hypothetical protein